jgi:CheY-like chemotaxis protein
MTDATVIDVLLVEDSEADARMIGRMLSAAGAPNRLTVVGDGVEALEHLRDPAQRMPGLILLDLNLPRMDGFATLEALKADGRLASIPVIILTSTGDSASVSRSYGLHASAFVTKPNGLEGYRAVVAAVEDFWLRQARLPSVAAESP